MKATNEELAVMIQSGDKSRIPELWERVRKLYMKKAFLYFDNHRELCSRCGVELDDIQQQAFFAFLRSVEMYEPECELAFNSYINYPFMTEMQELTRTRSSGQQQDCLNRCSSLDAPIDDEDGSGDTLCDFVPDPSALDFLELLDAQSVGAMIRNEVRQLPEVECEIITGIFFDGLTQSELARRAGLSQQRISMLKKRGLVALSKRRVLVDLWNEQHHTERLRKLERATEHNRPDDYEAGQRYAQTTQPQPKSCMDLAYEYAEQQRQLCGKSREEWTREEQIAAMLDYLHREPATV